MADFSIKPGADHAARGFIFNLLIPAVLGAFVAILFFQFVPEMISQLWDKKGWEEAFRDGFKAVATPYQAFFDPNAKKHFGLLGWPILGGIIGVYLGRLYLKN